MKPRAKVDIGYTPHEIRTIAVKLCIDPRTIRTYVKGGQVSRNTMALMERHGIKRIKSEPVKEEPAKKPTYRSSSYLFFCAQVGDLLRPYGTSWDVQDDGAGQVVIYTGLRLNKEGRSPSVEPMTDKGPKEA